MKYDNPTKQTWRGWAWNQIQSRVPPSSTVMVLAGEAAADLDHAKRRKLKCIAVDVNQDCVDAFRERGGVAICDKLQRQLIAISPQGAILDMLGGLTAESFGTTAMSAMACTAVVWNGLRGRDEGVGEIAFRMRNQPCPDYSSGRLRESEYGKHRGKLAFSILVAWCWLAECGQLSAAFTTGKVRAYEIPRDYFFDVAMVLRPAFQSYKSKDSSQYFDSIAWTNPRNLRSILLQHEDWSLARTKRCDRSRRKAAAAKALITMGRGA